MQTLLLNELWTLRAALLTTDLGSTALLGGHGTTVAWAGQDLINTGGARGALSWAAP